MSRWLWVGLINARMARRSEAMEYDRRGQLRVFGSSDITERDRAWALYLNRRPTELRRIVD